jgi:hypothetical protein
MELRLLLVLVSPAAAKRSSGSIHRQIIRPAEKQGLDSKLG